MRKSFILHNDSLDVVNELTIEQKAELFQAIIDYNCGKEVKLTGLMNAVFIPFKNQFIRDSEKYEKVIERNIENGSKGGRPKKTKGNPKNPVGYSETQTNQTEPKKPDNDNDNDNVNKNDNKNKNLNINNNDITISDKSEKKQTSYKQWTLEDFQNEMTKYKPKYPIEILMQFYDYWRELTPSGKMKLQLEKSWQTDLRIEKWFKNSHNFAPKNQKPDAKNEMHEAFKSAAILSRQKAAEKWGINQ